MKRSVDGVGKKPSVGSGLFALEIKPVSFEDALRAVWEDKLWFGNFSKLTQFPELDDEEKKRVFTQWFFYQVGVAYRKTKYVQPNAEAIGYDMDEVGTVALLVKDALKNFITPVDSLQNPYQHRITYSQLDSADVEGSSRVIQCNWTNDDGNKRISQWVERRDIVPKFSLPENLYKLEFKKDIFYPEIAKQLGSAGLLPDHDSTESTAKKPKN